MAIAKAVIPHATLASSFQNIANHIGADNRALQALSELASLVIVETNRAFGKAPTVTVAGASLTALLLNTGAVGVALGRTAALGDFFVSATTADTTGTPLTTAKGSAPAIGDLWRVDSATAVTFLGNSLAALDAALLPYTYRGFQVSQD